MKVFFISLGCDKNTVDSEMMLGILNKAGHTITYDENEAEAAVINSCAFIADAKQESINTILEMAALKNTGSLKVIAVTGCLSQRYKEEIRKEIPEVDILLGIQSFDKLAEALSECENGNSVTEYTSLDTPPICGYPRLLTTPTHYAYIKIAEGCNKHCTYCIIPGLRGKYRSVNMETLVSEAKDLADRGVKELILVAQETTLYGIDLYGEKKLPTLIKEFARIDGIERIRLLYCYPEEITDELIAVFKEEPKLCHYIDMPIQHGSDYILKRMARRTNEQDIRNIIGRLRSEIPDICIRTTLIIGFPGERIKDQQILKRFVEELKFDRLGVFTYSAEEGTPAEKMPNQIPEWLKARRRDTIMKLQQRIVFAKNEALVGKEFDVMIEGRLPEEDVYVSRSYMDAPGVDGYIFVKSDRDLMSGDILKACITKAQGYDLLAEEIE